jgi:hypothetical protein
MTKTNQGGCAFKKRVGATTYKVVAYFNGQISFEEKIMRIIEKDLHLFQNCAIIKVPQTMALFERSST